MKGRITFLVLLLAAIAVVFAYAETRPASQIVLTGIVATDDVIVSAQISGRVDKLLVNQGDTVSSGELLAKIEPAQQQADMTYYQSTQQAAATQVSQAQADLQYQQLQTQAQIAQAQGNLDAAKAQVAAAQAELESARIEDVREQQGYEKGAETAQAKDQAHADFLSQQAKLEAAQHQVTAATAALALAHSNEQQVAMRKAALDASSHQLAAAGAQADKAKTMLGYTDVRAPIAGIVDVRAALEGEVVNPGQAIVTLINEDDLWIRADVEETYIERITKGQTLEVRLPSGATRKGVVSYIGADADYATQRDVSRTKRDIKTFEIRVRCDNQDRALHLGMTAYVILPGVK